MTQSNWLQAATKSLKADPKKTGSLVVLSALLALVVVRQLAGRKGDPASAGAATIGNKLGTAASSKSTGGKTLTTNADALTRWSETPVAPISRNLFAVRMDYFPLDNSRTPQNSSNDEAFWLRLEKSMSLRTDERQRRENMVAGFKADAERLMLQSTMPGATPRAMIDGKLVGEGDVVANFRVSKIEPRRVIIEREGIMLEIQMK